MKNFQNNENHGYETNRCNMPELYGLRKFLKNYQINFVNKIVNN
jgi:hypothetical protein